MLFFRRRDATTSQSHLTDQERCIHACIFFAFIILIVTVVLFYFAATNKVSNDQRLYYYIGAGISLAFLLLIILCTIIYVRGSYGSSLSSRPQQGIISTNAYDQSRYSNHQT